MKLHLPDVDKAHVIKLLMINPLKYKTLLYRPSNFVHPQFFIYRQNFFNNSYNLINPKVSELQLTYMNTEWDQLTIKSVEVKTTKILKSRIHDLKILSGYYSKLLKPQLLHLLLHQGNTYIKSIARPRPQTKHLNSYYSFLRTRVSYSKRNYIQKLFLWYTQSLKYPSGRNTSLITDQRLRYTRRVKVKSLKRTLNNVKLNPLNSYTYNPCNYTKVTLYSNKSNLIQPSCGTIRSKQNVRPNSRRKQPRIHLYKNRTNTYLPRLTFCKNLRIRFSYGKFTNQVYRTRILSRYKPNYSKLYIFKSILYKNTNLTNIKPTNNNLNPSLLHQLHLKNPYYPKLNLTYVLDKESDLKVQTQSIRSFILRNKGLSIISQINWRNTFPNKLKSQFKKKLFSFIYPGQSKKNVLIRRKKQVLARLLSRSFKIITSIDNFSYRLFHQLFSIEPFTQKKNSLLNYHTSHTSLTYGLNTRNVHYAFDFNTKGFDLGDLYINSEVRIPRVRFKPGYQRIWRQVRSALKVALNVRFQYQQQLTKYLVKFYHLSSQYLLSYSESTLDKIVVYSQLLPDVSTTQLFSLHGFIYLNGTTQVTINTILIKNDFIQLVVSLWYYMINKWFMNWTNTRVRKFKRLVYRKNKPLQYRIMKNKKQQSYYTPNWIYQTRYDSSDIKPYLEVDFFTLSAFILTDTYIQYYHSVDDMPDLRNSTYMLYNWKYIT